MKTQQPPLKDAVDAFLQLHSMSQVTFGRKAMNDPHFVRDINAAPARRMWPETEAKVREWMSAYCADDEAEAA